MYARRTGSHSECGNAFGVLGKIAWRRSLHQTACRILHRSIRHFTRAGNLDGAARAWSLLGNVHVERCNFREATAAFQKASAIFSDLDHPLEVSLARFNLGLVYTEQARLAEAERIFQRCRFMDRKAGSKRYYAYDLRALAVVAVLQGFHRKASSLLNKALEIFTELEAENDVLQTQMIRMMNALEQHNLAQAQPLMELLQQQLESLQEPMARAEIHYLLGHYYGYSNENGKAIAHLDEALQASRKIHYYKLMGMCLILRLVFRNVMPSRKDRDLLRAIRCFRKSQNDLRLSDYLLKLYQAYPALLKERRHAARLAGMEKLYKTLRRRTRHRMVRRLVAGASRRTRAEPLYEKWHSLLQVMSGEGDLESRIRKTLALLAEDLRAASAGLWFKGAGWFRCRNSSEIALETEADFHERIRKLVASGKEPLIIEVAVDTELALHSYAQKRDVRSVMAVPMVDSGQVLGMWYFERWGALPLLTRKELAKANFFAMTSLPAMIHAFESAASQPPDASAASLIDFDFVGKSAGVLTLRRQIARLAPLDISVLIQGESGTGKELIARALHRHSPRAPGPFLPLNCSAIPEPLVESELFGYAKGAFTGASMTRQGSIERASGGTLFLDEIGDLSPGAQAKLLRVMQEKEIQRLGESTQRKVDVRFIFATHKDLKKLVREGNYREDLFYRISVYTLAVPPLRERREDIAVLLSHLTEKYSRSFSRGKIQYAAAAMQALSEYDWPGNVREMENLIQSLLVNVDAGGRIEFKDLPPQIKTGATMRSAEGMTLEEGRQHFERDFLNQALNRNGWNKTQTARELGITRQGLIQMIQRLALEKK
jgi:transcriptional regulator with GAF, ATPase, and Fis domain